MVYHNNLPFRRPNKKKIFSASLLIELELLLIDFHVQWWPCPNQHILDAATASGDQQLHQRIVFAVQRKYLYLQCVNYLVTLSTFLVIPSHMTYFIIKSVHVCLKIVVDIVILLLWILPYFQVFCLPTYDLRGIICQSYFDFLCDSRQATSRVRSRSVHLLGRHTRHRCRLARRRCRPRGL